MKNVMFDIETLGTRPTSVIVQIGACYFNRNTGEVDREFSVNIEPDDRFTQDQSTLDWWAAQSQEAKDAVFTGGIKLEEALAEFAIFLKDCEYLWSHATFDAPILSNAYAVLGMKMPVPYRGLRDIRTLMDLSNTSALKVAREGIHHNALDDAKTQVAYCYPAFKRLQK